MAISIPSLVKMKRSPRSFIGGKEESFLLVAKVLDLSATKTIPQRYIRIPSIENCTPFIYLRSDFYRTFHLRNPLKYLDESAVRCVRLRSFELSFLIRKRQFSQPFFTLQLVKIPTLLHTSSLKKVPL